ncbi:MAG: hypothetical protein ABI818_04540 [Acidobacteriota bacterium]
MKSTLRDLSVDGLPRRLAAAAAPLRPAVLGMAMGLLAAGVLAAVTAAHLSVLPRHAPELELLGQYLRGYHVSPAGVLIGAAWGGACGFMAGWLLASTRNLVVRLWLDWIRTKASLGGKDFLDGI